MQTPDIEAAIKALSHLDLDTNAVTVRQKSRDFFWYSPVLKARLDHVVADFTVAPRTEAEVIEVLTVCHAHGVPVTTRGAGTGNYGQAMPLAGGCVMHLVHMNAVKEVHPGRVIAEPGCLLKDLDAHCIADSGQEIRMFSSTWATATIGGFIAGGSGGVGSVRWGQLRDLGNIIRLRVVTMEAEPRVLDFTGEELARVSHAYGTNGIITEVEIPLAPAYEWVDVAVAFDDFSDAISFSYDLAKEDGILVKLITPHEAPIAHRYFQRFKTVVDETTSLVMVMVAPHSLPGFETFLARRGAGSITYRSDDNKLERHPGHLFEYGWNHTTLRALKVDPTITYLQVRYGGENPSAQVEAIREMFGEEVLQHLEVIRENGRVIFAGLPIVQFTSEERLDEIVAKHEEIGCMVFNPHRYTLEEGGRQTVDDRQLAFKREADPKGLLNPGKMIAWDDPNYGFKEIYAYPGMQPPAEAAE
ncbi:MAG: FAD-binding oxidoreductase [Pseudomonadota bacterium]